VREEWHHSDEGYYEGMDVGATWVAAGIAYVGPDHVGRIQDGLPWPDGFFSYVVSHHGLMMLPEPDLIPALVELRRVTKPGGWLRVSVPDMDGAIYARQHGLRGWFPVEAETIDQAFCIYVTQGGATRSVFTVDRLHSLLKAAGWGKRIDCDPFDSYCGLDGITDLDSRPGESLFVEAVNPV
jgi:SAM-dependent methyltransferase